MAVIGRRDVKIKRDEAQSWYHEWLKKKEIRDSLEKYMKDKVVAAGHGKDFIQVGDEKLSVLDMVLEDLPSYG